MKLINWFKSKTERKPELKDAIQKVFSINGVNYYQFKDIAKIKCQRALTVNDFYNELTMRATRDFLIQHTEAIEKILNSNNIDIYKVNTLNNQLKERLEMIYETDIIYKIASVVYFTKEENPYEYDDLVGREKIDLFKSQGDAFFFKTLFRNLIGSVSTSEKDLATYMKVGKEITTEHLKSISTILSN